MASFQLVDDTDPRVFFSGSWVMGGVEQEFNGTTHGTFVGGSQARFTFNGSSVEVYGTISNQSALSPRSTYSIDGSKDVLFNPVPTSVQHQQLFYQSPTLDNKEHVLLITSLSSRSAFWLDFFRVGTAGTSPLPTSIPPTNHPRPSAPSSNKSNSISFPPGAIAGAVFGSLTLVALLAIIICFVLRRRAPQRELIDPDDIEEAAESPSYPKPPPPALILKEDTSMPSIASSAAVSSYPFALGPPISGNPSVYGYGKGGGLITMTAAPSENSPYGPGSSSHGGHSGADGSFTQVVYYQTRKSMTPRVVDVLDLPPAYTSPS